MLWWLQLKHRIGHKVASVFSLGSFINRSETSTCNWCHYSLTFMYVLLDLIAKAQVWHMCHRLLPLLNILTSFVWHSILLRVETLSLLPLYCSRGLSSIDPNHAHAISSSFKWRCYLINYVTWLNIISKFPFITCNAIQHT